MVRIKWKLLLALIILSAIFLPPFAKYQELRYKNRKLNERIRDLKSQIKRLAQEKARLKTDEAYIEKKAREKMGVVRKGEIVLKEVAQEETQKK